MVSEQPVKILGRCYNASLKDKEQVQQLRQEIVNGLENINKTPLPCSVILLLKDLRSHGQALWKTIRAVSEVAERAASGFGTSRMTHAGPQVPRKGEFQRRLTTGHKLKADQPAAGHPYEGCVKGMKHPGRARLDASKMVAC